MTTFRPDTIPTPPGNNPMTTKRRKEASWTIPESRTTRQISLTVRNENGYPTWQNEQDADGKGSSQLGFRLVIEADGQVRVLDAKSGRRYLRPSEVEMPRRPAEPYVTQVEQRVIEAEQRAAEEAGARQALTDELARLQAKLAQIRRSPQ